MLGSIAPHRPGYFSMQATAGLNSPAFDVIQAGNIVFVAAIAFKPPKDTFVLWCEISAFNRNQPAKS